ncbi:hypothetical protein T4D_14962 [Trichinella pseudospiralis]|uniref:Uncharacterized protein n=1 Tax=Trichinella pseudospiralis TaxID=6337 RepID=A0A0V1F802_TRIPS|nr:hypothetical protein T4D_14962 [Trichinella pseudospiralis]
MYAFIKILSSKLMYLIVYFVSICFPMCALLILLLNMRKQLKEQESKLCKNFKAKYAVFVE